MGQHQLEDAGVARASSHSWRRVEATRRVQRVPSRYAFEMPAVVFSPHLFVRRHVFLGDFYGKRENRARPEKGAQKAPPQDRRPLPITFAQAPLQRRLRTEAGSRGGRCPRVVEPLTIFRRGPSIRWTPDRLLRRSCARAATQTPTAAARFLEPQLMLRDTAMNLEERSGRRLDRDSVQTRRVSKATVVGYEGGHRLPGGKRGGKMNRI